MVVALLRARPVVRVAVGAAALALLLTACSGKGGQGDASAQPTAEMGPLSAYMEKIGGAQDDADYQEMSRRSEELIAQCMADEGFEYVPVDQSGQMAVSTGSDDMPAWDSVEYATLYGYGITTYEDMPGYTEVTTTESTDPNQDIVAAMSDAERDAYYAALYGEQVEPDPDAEATPEATATWDWSTAGCQGAAQHEVYEQDQPWADPDFQALQEEMSTLWEGMVTDSRITDAETEWSSCMADAGYTFDAPQDAQTSISDAANALWGDGEPDDAAMASLRELEIATAVADRTCTDSVGLTDVQTAVQLELEQQFVDAHKAELDAWVARYAPAD